jgi:hypothetical protein
LYLQAVPPVLQVQQQQQQQQQQQAQAQETAFMLTIT